MKIKVIHLIKSLGRGGAEMLLPETLRAHDKNKFEFSYGYFVPEKNQMVEALTSQGVEVACFNAKNPFNIIRKYKDVANFAKASNADIIHCHLPLAGVSGRLAGKVTNIPIIYTEHNKQERYNYFTRKANLWTMPINKMVLTVSEDVENSIRNAIPDIKTPIRTLLNGVDTQKFNPDNYTNDLRKELNLTPETMVIGTVAVFRDQKRLHLWLELAKKITEVISNTFFMLIGDGPNLVKLQQLSKDFGLTDKIAFPGRLEEVRPWLKTMDIYMMTSEFEGLPIAMLEAMSMELPVVATQAGGIGEVITNDQDGYLAHVDNWINLLEPVIALANDASIRKRIGKAARQTVMAKFSIQRMARELEEIYESVLNATK